MLAFQVCCGGLNSSHTMRLLKSSAHNLRPGYS